MAEATYSVATGGTTVSKIWKKVQGPLAQAINFDCEEWSWFDDLKNYNLDVSSREMTVPLDITEGYGAAAIGEGDFEAVPSSPNLDEITLGVAEMSKRFTISWRSKILDERHRNAQVQRQMVYQGRKAIQALSAHYSDLFYGFSTGVICETSTAATATSGTAYTLNDGYGVSDIDSAAFLGSKFQVGERVALIRSDALVTNAIGTVTARSLSTPSITVTWNGSVTSVAGDLVVKANSMENATIAGTDYNKTFAGLLDMYTSASLHGLTHANYVAAYADTNAGRFSGTKIQIARDEIGNEGGGKMDTLITTQGVKRDLIALQSAALRFSDPFALELDGDIKSKGLTIKTSRRVPPGYVFAAAKDSIRKLNVMPKPGEAPTWSDAIRMENKAGYILPINWLVANVCLNRKNLAYFSGQTEQ